MSDNTHEAPLDAPTCSPSSTPETDAAWDCDHPLYRRSDKEKRELASKLERERDALKAAGVEIIEAARRSMPRKHGTIERNAKLFISENTPILPQ